jgi:hypothetical protein
VLTYRLVQGADFDPTFTPWLFSRAAAIASGTATIPPATSAVVEAPVEAMDVQTDAPLTDFTVPPVPTTAATSQQIPTGPVTRDQDMRDGRQDGMNGRNMQMDRSMGGPSNHPGAFQPGGFQPGPNFARGRGHGRGRGGHHGPGPNARESALIRSRTQSNTFGRSSLSAAKPAARPSWPWILPSAVPRWSGPDGDARNDDAPARANDADANDDAADGTDGAGDAEWGSGAGESGWMASLAKLTSF